MKGIPVRPGGDPVRLTFVIAGNHREFMNWCMYSRVNPCSRKVRWLHTPERLRGVPDADFVYTGTGGWHVSIDYAVEAVQRGPCYQGTVYRQRESCEIEPNIVDEMPGLRWVGLWGA